MKKYLQYFNDKYQTTFKKVKGSKDYLYSDGLLFLRFDNKAVISILMFQIPRSCESLGEDYMLLENGNFDDIHFMLYT